VSQISRREDHRRDHRVKRDDRAVPPAGQGDDGEENRRENCGAFAADAPREGGHQQDESGGGDPQKRVAKRDQDLDVKKDAHGIGGVAHEGPCEDVLDDLVDLAALREGFFAVDLVENTHEPLGEVRA